MIDRRLTATKFGDGIVTIARALKAAGRPRAAAEMLLKWHRAGELATPPIQTTDQPSLPTSKTMSTTTTTAQKANTPAGTKAGGGVAVMKAATVRDPSARLSTKRYTVKRPDGNALVWGSKAVETPSEHDRAVVGVWFKSALRKIGLPVELTEWERSLLSEYATKGQWVGTAPNGDYFGGGADGYAPAERVKALLDDTFSGGLYLAPAVLDAAVITQPLLSGQVFPFVDLKVVEGRRVMLQSINNLTVSWGVTPGTAVVPMDTSALVNPLDTAVFGVAGYIELSNELLADSPVNIGATVVELYGQRLKAELDRVVVNGNGIAEPLGIVNATGLAAVNTDNGLFGPPTVTDAEALMFAVPLQYRLMDLNPGYIMNDVSYSRYHGIKVGVTDQRRVFGMQGTVGGTGDKPQYALFGHPVHISADLPNNVQIFGGLRKYRMYQRAGMELVRANEGRALTLRNTTLVGLRARFGGRVVDGNAFSKATDAQD